MSFLYLLLFQHFSLHNPWTSSSQILVTAVVSLLLFLHDVDDVGKKLQGSLTLKENNWIANTRQELYVKAFHVRFPFTWHYQ